MAGADSSSEAEAAAAAVEKQLVKEHTRCKPVRKPLPVELPRVEIEIVPPEVEREPDASSASQRGHARFWNGGRPPSSR